MLQQTLQRTLAIIKPDAVERRLAGRVIQRIEDEGFQICAMRRVHLSMAQKWRTLMGATDPAKADAGTLRKEFAQSIERNATHGSDAPETAAYEIGYFFAGVEIG